MGRWLSLSKPGFGEIEFRPSLVNRVIESLLGPGCRGTRVTSGTQTFACSVVKAVKDHRSPKWDSSPSHGVRTSVRTGSAGFSPSTARS